MSNSSKKPSIIDFNAKEIVEQYPDYILSDNHSPISDIQIKIVKNQSLEFSYGGDVYEFTHTFFGNTKVIMYFSDATLKALYSIHFLHDVTDLYKELKNIALRDYQRQLTTHH